MLQETYNNAVNESNKLKKGKVEEDEAKKDTKPGDIKPPGIYWCKDTKKIVKKGKNDKDKRDNCKPDKPKTPN